MKRKEQLCRSELLRLSARVMVIFGILSSVIFLLLLMAVLGFLYLTGGVFNATMSVVGVGLLLLAGISEFIAGILGGRSCKTGHRLISCLVWGGLTLALTVAGTVVNFQTAPKQLLLTLVLELVLPILYLIGAVQVMRRPAPAEAAPTKDDPAEAASGEPDEAPAESEETTA